jgi:LacI family transcriptional regulator
MKQIAEKAGVSRTTVSFVLNNTPDKNIPTTTRERVLKIANELGYFQAMQHQTHTVGFAIRQIGEQIAQDALLGEVLSGLSNALEPYGYHVVFFPLPPQNEIPYLDLILNYGPSGLVLSGPLTKDDKILQTLSQENMPIVILGQVPSPEVYCVDVDNTYGARMAVNHLIELGHRRIAMITNAPLDYTASVDRLSGYKQTLANYGILYDESLVRCGHFTSESGFEAMQDILNNVSEPPTAVFVASDVVALGAMQAVRDSGLRIPDDISFVGFDDIPLARYLDPPLTTVRIFAYDEGKYAGDVLMRLLNRDGRIPRRTLLDSELKIRQSTIPITQ